MHYQIDFSMKDLRKCLASIKKVMKFLGNVNWSKFDKKINITFSDPKVLS